MTAHVLTLYRNARPGAVRGGWEPGDALAEAEPRFTLQVDAASPVDAARMAYRIGHGEFRDHPADPWPRGCPPVRVGDVLHVLHPDPDGCAIDTWVAVGPHRLQPLTHPPQGSNA